MVLDQEAVASQAPQRAINAVVNERDASSDSVQLVTPRTAEVVHQAASVAVQSEHLVHHVIREWISEEMR
jgi:hypothetical protein